MNHICFFDHEVLAKDRLPVPKAGGISYKYVLQPSLRRALDIEEEYLSKATKAVLHFTYRGIKSELESWKTAWRSLKDPCPCLIMLMVSEDGKEELRQERHQKWEHPNCRSVAYVLYAKNQQVDLEDDVKHAREVLSSFYDMSALDAEAVYSERVHECPASLRSLFLQPLSLQLVPMLSVLFQGFLALHTNSKGEPEAVPKDETDDVCVALDKMRWPDFCKGTIGRNVLKETLIDDSTAGVTRRRELRQQVFATAYWEPLLCAVRELETHRGNAIQTIREEEWDKLAGGRADSAMTDDEEWEEVKKALDALRALALATLEISPDISVDEDERSGTKAVHDLSQLTPGIVARAFIQLSNRLGSA